MSRILAITWPVSDAIVERLGWVLIHSLWQFAVVGLVAAVVLRVLHNASSTARHGALVCLLGIAALAPIATAALQPAARAPSGAATTKAEDAIAAIPRADRTLAADESPGIAGPAAELLADSDMPEEKPAMPVDATAVIVRSKPMPSIGERIQRGLAPLLPWIVGCWFVGVLVGSLRPLVGWRTLRRLRRVGTSAPSDAVLAALDRVSARLGLRRTVRVFHSALAYSPMLVGYLRPVVLLPVALAASMPVSQLEAILAHELAHVRRHDFLVNLLQTLIETLFFYHPAIWWISRRIRIEREHCCDDLVVALFDNRADYGRALIAVEQLPNRAASLALGAGDGSLLARIRRIVGSAAGRESRSFDRWQTAWISLAGVGVLLVALTFHWTASAQVPPASSPNATERSADDEGANDDAAKEPAELDDAKAGDPAFVLLEHRFVAALGFTRDGKSLVSIAWDKAPDSDGTRFTIRAFETAEKKLTREVELQWQQDWNRNAGSMMLSHDRTKVIGSLGEQISIWDAESGMLVRRLDPPEELRKDALLFQLSCTPDLSRIACARTLKYDGGLIRDSHVIVWNANTGEVVQTITLKGAYDVYSISLSADGKRVATAAGQRGADVWDVASGERLLEYRNDNRGRKHPDPEVKEGTTELVLDAALSPDGKLLAVSDMLGVKLIDSTTGKVFARMSAPFRYHSGSPSLIFSSDSRFLARIGTCMKLKQERTERVTPIWSTETGGLVMSVPTEASDVSFSNDSKWIAVGYSDRKEAVGVWRVAAPDDSP